MVGGRGEVGRDGCESVSNVAEVVGLGGLCDQFVDHRAEVVQGRDGRERWSALRAEGPARHGEEHRGADDLEGDTAVVECGGQPAVTAAQVPGGAGSEAIEVEGPLDVEPARDR